MKPCSPLEQEPPSDECVFRGPSWQILLGLPLLIELDLSSGQFNLLLAAVKGIVLLFFRDSASEWDIDSWFATCAEHCRVDQVEVSSHRLHINRGQRRWHRALLRVVVPFV